jgi:hypothetical protein
MPPASTGRGVELLLLTGTCHGPAAFAAHAILLHSKRFEPFWLDCLIPRAHFLALLQKRGINRKGAKVAKKKVKDGEDLPQTSASSVEQGTEAQRGQERVVPRNEDKSGGLAARQARRKQY